MKLLAVFAALSMAQDTPHDPEAQAFCEGKQEGYYANPKDCGSYFFCWNQGNILNGYNNIIEIEMQHLIPNSEMKFFTV